MRCDLPVLLLVGFAFACFYTLTQPVMTYENGLFADAVHYRQMILQTAAGEPLSANKPFVYRVGLPMMVGWTLQLVGGDPISLLKFFHFIFGLLGYLVFLLILLRLVSNRAIAYALSLVFLTNYSVPFRLGGIFPYYVDPPAMFMSMLVLYLNLVWRELTLWRLGVLCTIAVLGVVLREYVLAALLASGFARHVHVSHARPWIVIESRSKFIAGLLPFAVGLMTFFAVQMSVYPKGDYSFAGHARWSLLFNLMNSRKLLLDALVCYGPMLLVILLVTRKVWNRALEYPMLLAYTLIAFTLALIGGSHTPRFFYWGAPAILPFLGWVLLSTPARPARHSKFLFGALVLLQLIANRAFLPVPDVVSMVSTNLPEYLFLAPYGENAHYWHLWPLMMSREAQNILLFQYGCLAAVVLFVRFRCRGIGAR